MFAKCGEYVEREGAFSVVQGLCLGWGSVVSAEALPGVKVCI